MNDNSDVIDLEAKSDRELLLLVATTVNEHTRATKSIRSEVATLRAEIEDCPMLPRNHQNGHAVLTRLNRIEHKLLYLAIGVILLTVLSFSTNEASRVIPLLMKGVLP